MASKSNWEFSELGVIVSSLRHSSAPDKPRKSQVQRERCFKAVTRVSQRSRRRVYLLSVGGRRAEQGARELLAGRATCVPCATAQRTGPARFPHSRALTGRSAPPSPPPPPGAWSSSRCHSREALKGKTGDSHFVLSIEGGLGRIPRKGGWHDGGCV